MPVPPPAQYWWAANGTQHGPISLDELKALAAQDKLSGDTLVWTATFPDWRRADTIPDLGLTTAANAVAASMTGRFQTGGQPVTYFDFTQTGTNLTGVLSGGDTGTLTGTVDPDGKFNGTLSLQGQPNVQFRGTFAASGFAFTIFGPGGSTDLQLTPVAAVAAAQYYWVSDQGQQGPVSGDELRSLIAAGTLKADTLVWADGMADWTKAADVADLKDLFAPTQSADYYVVAGGQQVGPLTLEQLLARIRSGETKADDLVWKAGMADWGKAGTLAELAAAFPAEPLAPPPHLTAKTITLAPIAPGMSEAELHKSSIVLGAVLGVFLHEMGHAMIGELDLPAVGPEEDTADEFSALLLGSSFSREQMKDETDPVVVKWTTDLARYSTLLWYYLNQSTNGRAGPWFDEHANTARRFRNTLCRIYGADPVTYVDVADKVKLPDDQRRLCTQEYKRHFNAWVRIVANVTRDPGGDLSVPGNLPANTPGKKVTMAFAPSQLGTGEALTPVFRDSGILESFAKIFSDNFVFTKRDIAVTFKDCGMANAWYDPGRGTVTMCWEVVEDFAGTILDAEKVPRH